MLLLKSFIVEDYVVNEQIPLHTALELLRKLLLNSQKALPIKA